MQNLGEQAQAEDHHPVMVVEWGRVGVTWWTHTLNGVHRNDAIMAARSDQRSLCEDKPLECSHGMDLPEGDPPESIY